MAEELLQIRLDKNLADRAAEIFSKVGLDIQSAVQIFLKRSVRDRGIPFSMRAPEEEPRFDITTRRAIEAMKEMSRAAERAGISNMTLDEINAEIEAVRNEKKAKIICGN